MPKKEEREIKRIEQMRKYRRLTRDQVAQLYGVNKSTVVKWETSEGLPSIKVLFKLAEIYDTTPDNLIIGYKEKNES